MGLLQKKIINIKTIKNEEISELVGFHNAYYKTKRRTEHWIWQYRQYKPDKAVFAVIKENDRIIGTQAMMPIYFRIGSKIVLTGKSENTLLLPEYRRKGIMIDLYEFAIEECRRKGYQYIWGFTDAKDAFEKFGFSSYPIPKLYIRPSLDFINSISVRIRSNRSALEKALSIMKFSINYMRPSNLGMAVPRPFAQNTDSAIGTHKIEIQKLEDYYANVALDFPEIVTPYYNAAYINWRIRKHPFLNYHEYQVVDKAVLKAYAFVVLSEGRLSISDLQSEDTSYTVSLIMRIIRDFSKLSEQFVLLLNPESRILKEILPVLHKIGFKSNDAFNLVLRDLSDKKYGEIFELKNWNINGLWTEGYRM